MVEAVDHPTGGASVTPSRTVAQRRQAAGKSHSSMLSLCLCICGCVVSTKHYCCLWRVTILCSSLNFILSCILDNKSPFVLQCHSDVSNSNPFMTVCCFPTAPPPPSSTVSNHTFPPRPSLELAVVHGVTSSPPHLLSQAHSGNIAASYLDSMM